MQNEVKNEVIQFSNLCYFNNSIFRYMGYRNKI